MFDLDGILWTCSFSRTFTQTQVLVQTLGLFHKHRMLVQTKTTNEHQFHSSEQIHLICWFSSWFFAAFLFCFYVPSFHTGFVFYVLCIFYVLIKSSVWLSFIFWLFYLCYYSISVLVYLIFALIFTPFIKCCIFIYNFVLYFGHSVLFEKCCRNKLDLDHLSLVSFYQIVLVCHVWFSLIFRMRRLEESLERKRSLSRTLQTQSETEVKGDLEEKPWS